MRIIIFILLISFSTYPAISFAEVLESFDARYRVTSNQYSLAPSATIEHRLIYNNGEIYSRMQASIPFSRWKESARFQLNGKDLQAQTYEKSTRVFLKRRSYTLSEDQFNHTQPAFDRQSAIFYMAYSAPQQPADSSTSIIQVDARGQTDKLIIDFAGIKEYQNQEISEVFFWKEKKPAEYTQAYFSVNQPGLLVFAQVFGKEGEKLLTFELLDWQKYSD